MQGDLHFFLVGWLITVMISGFLLYQLEIATRPTLIGHNGGEIHDFTNINWFSQPLSRARKILEHAANIFQKKWIYVIMPTSHRSTRLTDLTHLSQTLAHVPHLKWILVDNGGKADTGVVSLLQRKHERFHLDFVYLGVTDDSPALSCSSRESARLDAGLEWLLNQTFPTSPIDFVDKEAGSDQVTKFKAVLPGSCRPTWKIDFVITKLDRAKLRSNPLSAPVLPSGIIYLGRDDSVYDTDLFDEEIRNVCTLKLLNNVSSRSREQVRLSPHGNNSSNHPAQENSSISIVPIEATEIEEIAMNIDYMFLLNPNKTYWYYPMCGERCSFLVSPIHNLLRKFAAGKSDLI